MERRDKNNNETQMLGERLAKYTSQLTIGSQSHSGKERKDCLALSLSFPFPPVEFILTYWQSCLSILLSIVLSPQESCMTRTGDRVEEIEIGAFSSPQ